MKKPTTKIYRVVVDNANNIVRPQERQANGNWKDINRGANSRPLVTLEGAIRAVRYNVHYFNVSIYQIEGVDKEPVQALPVYGSVVALFLANNTTPRYFLPKFNGSDFMLPSGAIMMFDHRWAAEDYLKQECANPDSMAATAQFYQYDDYRFPH